MAYNIYMKPNTSIRIDKEILHQAKIAAVTDNIPLGEWLEQAIKEKIARSQKGNDNNKSR
jgi:hypothetical protein